MLFKCPTLPNQTRSHIHIYIRDKDERLKVWSKIAPSRKARTVQITSDLLTTTKEAKIFSIKVCLYKGARSCFGTNLGNF